jgi:hypothetical protein
MAMIMRIVPAIAMRMPIAVGESWIGGGVETSAVACDNAMEEDSVSEKVCDLKESDGGIVDVGCVEMFGGATVRVEPAVVDRVKVDDSEVLDEENEVMEEVLVVVDTIEVDTVDDSSVGWDAWTTVWGPLLSPCAFIGIELIWFLEGVVEAIACPPWIEENGDG